MNKSKDRVRVVIVERNQVLRKSIASYLSEHRISIASFASFADALSSLREMKPHVVLLDMLHDGVEPLDFLSSLKNETPALHVVVINSRLTQTQVVEYVRMGVSGFILSEATPDVYLETIRTVASGSKVLPPPLMGTLFDQIMHAGSETPVVRRSGTGLTKRESEIIGLIADGLNNKDIASRLSISECTVKNHVHSVLEKLNVRSRLELAHVVHERSSR